MSEESTQQEQEVPSPSSPKKRSGLSLFRLAAFVVIVGVVAVGGYSLLKGGLIDKAVAVVNGEKITQEKYDSRQAQLASVLSAQGQDPTSEELVGIIKQQVLDDLVAETLILQEAKKEGITAKEDEVNAVFEQSKSQFADEKVFADELTKQGFTESSFRATLTNQNIFQQYLNAHVDLASVSATEEEVEALYEQSISGGGENIPELEEVRDQVQAEVVRQKQQALINEFMNNLRNSSQIEILI